MDKQNQQEEIEAIFSYYDQQRDKSSQEMVVSLLRELQEVQGYLTPELKQRVIETTGVSEQVLKCLIRMYPSFKEVQTLHKIVVCTGERCANKGNLEILNRIKKELKISKDGISADGKFELRTQNCLKQCRTSPNLMVDGVLYSGEEVKRLSQKGIRSIIEKTETRNAGGYKQ